jgi:hypothetical protein
MLKKISTTELCVGMYVEKLNVSWVNHPFWKSSFKIESLKDLQKIKTSKVIFAWIDDSKGVDIPLKKNNV